jgi:hypothetical protein
MNLDQELRAALRRTDPPPGFADRVTARSSPRREHYRFAAWAAAAGLLLAGALEYRRRAEGERARNETMLALRIAARELETVQRKLDRIRSVSDRTEEP